jgi:acyl-coenzyme A thioesterase PaaI-like protein
MTNPLPTAEELVGLMPYAVALGITLDHATPEEVRGALAWAEDRCTAGGVMHGGALMTLADSVAAVCAYLNLPPGATTSVIHRRADRPDRRPGQAGRPDHPDAGGAPPGVGAHRRPVPVRTRWRSRGA